MFLIFPYRIARPFKMPWATIGIMVACIVVYALQLATGLERSYALLGFRPVLTGAITWFTAMFAHAGLFHLLGNLYFLWIFGGVLEDTIGRSRYLLLYLCGGLVSALVHSAMMLAFAPEQLMIPTVGASGAIAAVMGVAAVRFYRLKLEVWYWFWLVLTMRSGTFGVPALAGVVLYFARELLDGVMALSVGTRGVAHWSHVGGVAFGIAVAYLFGLAKDLDREEAEREARGWRAIGRSDLAADCLVAAGVDGVEISLTRARQAVGRTAPDIAAAAVDVRSALRALLSRSARSEVATVYREFHPYANTPLFFDASLLMAVGGACESIGDKATAAQAYYDVLHHHPKAPESERALYRLAHVYLAQGKRPEAEQTWAAFTSHFPASQWIAHADQRLTA